MHGKNFQEYFNYLVGGKKKNEPENLMLCSESGKNEKDYKSAPYMGKCPVIYKKKVVFKYFGIKPTGLF